MTTTVHCMGIGMLPDEAPERATPWAPHVHNATGPEADRCIAAFLATLEREPLDPTFERYGCFCEPLGGGRVMIWGNFAELSAVFEIYTDDPAVLDRLFAAISANRRRPDYRRARYDWQRVQRTHAERQREANAAGSAYTRRPLTAEERRAAR